MCKRKSRRMAEGYAQVAREQGSDRLVARAREVLQVLDKKDMHLTG